MVEPACHSRRYSVRMTNRQTLLGLLWDRQTTPLPVFDEKKTANRGEVPAPPPPPPPPPRPPKPPSNERSGLVQAGEVTEVRGEGQPPPSPPSPPPPAPPERVWITKVRGESSIPTENAWSAGKNCTNQDLSPSSETRVRGENPSPPPQPQPPTTEPSIVEPAKITRVRGEGS